MQRFGLIGLGVMGRNLALNVERNGFSISVYNRTESVTRDFLAGPASGKKIVPAFSLREFATSLERPRRILLLVEAGPAVDAVIKELAPFLRKGDILIDGGDSFYLDTERRAKELEPKGVAAWVLYPGSVATEFIQDAAKEREMDLSTSQTPLLVGRAAVALMEADDGMARSGTIQWVEDLAEEFDLVDEHGKRPPGYAQRVR